MRDADQCAIINSEHRNPKYLSNFSLRVEGGSEIRGICTLDELRDELSTPGVVILHALPCQLTPSWFAEHKDVVPDDALICVTAKGLYLKTYQLMGHAILDALDRADQPLAFLSGPSFAEEILKGNPTTLVVASDAIFNAVRIQKMLSNFKTVRVFTSDDPVGVQASKAISNLNLFLHRLIPLLVLTFENMYGLFVINHSARWSSEESFGGRCRNGNRDGIRHEHPLRSRYEGV
jgi:glycerol-3-phosphate dehydrogenase (NAD+)